MNVTLEEIRNVWWYYTVQLEDGSVLKGMYPDNYAFPPRMMQRRLDLRGMDCLDIGCAEGLLPILAKKSGATSVLATDYDARDRKKISYLCRLHKVSIDFSEIGRAENVSSLIGNHPGGFDYINLSGCTIPCYITIRHSARKSEVVAPKWPNVGIDDLYFGSRMSNAV